MCSPTNFHQVHLVIIDNNLFQSLSGFPELNSVLIWHHLTWLTCLQSSSFFTTTDQLKPYKFTNLEGADSTCSESNFFFFRLTVAFILKLRSALGGFQKKAKQGEERWVHGIPEVLRKSMLKFQGSITKEMEFPAVIKKKLCGIGISVCLAFLPWNSQGVPHNFVEYWMDFFWNTTFRSNCLHMLRNQPLEHEMFCFAKTKLILNAFKH